MSQKPYISLVMPMYNEAGNIGVLLKEIIDVFDTNVRKSYEIIIVDDASSDESVAVVEQVRNSCFSQEKPVYMLDLRLLRQSVRSGQFKALSRGLSEAFGDLVITMDSDLQQAPSDIPRLLQEITTCDMVCGVRRARHDGIARSLCSKIANGFRNLITGDMTADSGCMFRVIRSGCLPAIKACEGHLFGCEGFFFPLLVRRKGFHVTDVPVTHRKRGVGTSRYHLIRGRLMYGIAACLKIRFGGIPF